MLNRHPIYLHLSLWAGLLGLTILVYWPSLSGGFLFDDVGNIVNNTSLHITHVNFGSLESSLNGPKAGPLGRPVSVLSLALTYYFFGLNPFAFKAINLAIHLANGLLVAWFITLLLRSRPGVDVPVDIAKWLPIWVAAIWLVHPINIVPIILSVQRMALLSSMFMLLSLVSHLKGTSDVVGKTSRWFWLVAGWLVFWPLAVLSKETGLLFPLLVLLITLLKQGLPSHQATQSGRRIVLMSAISLLGIGGAMLGYLGLSWLNQAYAMRDFTLAERLMTEARVLWFYAGQIVIPSYTLFGLYLDDFQLSTSLFHPLTTLMAIIGWALGILGIAYGWQRWPIPSFALAWFLAGHSLESTFLPLEIAQEYRNYTPSIGLILGVGYIGASWLSKLKLDHREFTMGFVAVAPFLVLALFTWMRADQWGDPIRATQLEAAHHPGSSRANYSAAQTLFAAGHGDAGDPIGGQIIQYHFTQAKTVDPNDKLSPLGLIVWSCASGRPVQKIWVIDLTKRLEFTAYAPKDLELPSDLLKPLINMPNCLTKSDAIGLFEAGSRNLRISRSMRALFLESAADYMLLVRADSRSAKTYLDSAVTLNPENPILRRKQRSFDIIPVR